MNKVMKWSLGVVIVLALLIGGGVLWFLKGTPDAQEKASLSDLPVDAPTGSGSSIEGRWNLVPANPDDPTLKDKLYGGFRIDVNLAGTKKEITSRTPNVTGYNLIKDGAFQPAQIDTDITTLTTTDGAIDTIIAGVIKSEKYPTAVLKITGTTKLPEGLTEGQDFHVDLPVTFSIGGSERPYTLGMDGKWTGDTLVVAGNLPIKTKDHDLVLPPLPGTSVGDVATIEFQLLHKRVPA